MVGNVRICLAGVLQMDKDETRIITGQGAQGHYGFLIAARDRAGGSASEER